MTCVMSFPKLATLARQFIFKLVVNYNWSRTEPKWLNARQTASKAVCIELIARRPTTLVWRQSEGREQVSIDSIKQASPLTVASLRRSPPC